MNPVQGKPVATACRSNHKLACGIDNKGKRREEKSNESLSHDCRVSVLISADGFAKGMKLLPYALLSMVEEEYVWDRASGSTSQH